MKALLDLPMSALTQALLDEDCFTMPRATVASIAAAANIAALVR